MKLYGVVGWKNSGKTGLVERLVADIAAQGIRVSTVKHAHAGADIDTPGTDSFRHRAAGAAEVMLVTPSRWALMSELRGKPEPSLAEAIARLGPTDLVIAEGWKREGHPKIEAHRAATGQPLIADTDTSIRAVASDTPDEVTWAGGPIFDLDDTAAIARFILADVGVQ
ncbi:MAG: molybdopterin-guanine dinucleotide biosynthesis protein B [Pseudomonadota bacterium]